MAADTARTWTSPVRSSAERMCKPLKTIVDDFYYMKMKIIFANVQTLKILFEDVETLKKYLIMGRPMKTIFEDI